MIEALYNQSFFVQKSSGSIQARNVERAAQDYRQLLAPEKSVAQDYSDLYTLDISEDAQYMQTYLFELGTEPSSLVRNYGEIASHVKKNYADMEQQSRLAALDRAFQSRFDSAVFQRAEALPAPRVEAQAISVPEAQEAPEVVVIPPPVATSAPVVVTTSPVVPVYTAPPVLAVPPEDPSEEQETVQPGAALPDGESKDETTPSTSVAGEPFSAQNVRTVLARYLVNLSPEEAIRKAMSQLNGDMSKYAQVLIAAVALGGFSEKSSLVNIAA